MKKRDHLSGINSREESNSESCIDLLPSPPLSRCKLVVLQARCIQEYTSCAKVSLSYTVQAMVAYRHRANACSALPLILVPQYLLKVERLAEC